MAYAPPTNAPPPTCPFCRHPLDPATDVLYRSLNFGAWMMVIYCGWCGSVLGGGPSSSLHGSKTMRGG